MWRLRPTCVAAEAGAQQQLGRAERAAGDDHGVGARTVNGRRRPFARRARRPRQLDPGRAAVLDAGSGATSTPARSRAPAATARGR